MAGLPYTDEERRRPDTFDEGCQAAHDELGRNRNPYPDATSWEARRWDDGWCFIMGRR